MRLLLVSVIGCAGPQAAVREPACQADAKVVLRGQDDVAAAARCLMIRSSREIASLEIRTGMELDLAPLAKLHAIRGDLRVGPSVGFVKLELPALTSAGSITIAGNGDLHGIRLPALVSAGAVTVASNVSLTSLVMPRLAKAAAIVVDGHAELGLVELSSLVTVAGELTIRANPRLTLLELGKLERAGAVQVENNGELDASIVDVVRSKISP